MTKSKYRSIVVAAVVAMACTACGYLPKFDGDKVEYKSARQMPKLEVPPDLAKPGAADTFAVPDVNPKGDTTYSAYSREHPNGSADGGVGAAVLPSQPNARIERDGSQRWLVINAPPAASWNVAKDFWEEAGFILESEDAKSGVMETAWIENTTQVPDDNKIRSLLGKFLNRSMVSTANAPVAAGERVKFRTRLERGKTPDSTEIYISYRGMRQAFQGTEQSSALWEFIPSDPEVEAEMLRRMMVQFGIKPDVAKALKPEGADITRATLVKSTTGAGTLSVNDQFDRAWRRVGLALDRVGFTVEDRDRSKGLYYVRYADPDAKGNADAKKSSSFLSKLNPFSSSKSDSSKPLSTDQFRIQIKDGDSVSEVNVLTKDGAQEKSDTANRILSLLYEQLK